MTENRTASQIAAANGATYLDRVEGGPRWADSIDLGVLDMGCPNHCVLGQLEGDYGKAVSKHYQNASYDCYRLGFQQSPEVRGTTTQWLDKAWHLEIATRQTSNAEQRHVIENGLGG